MLKPSLTPPKRWQSPQADAARRVAAGEPRLHPLAPGDGRHAVRPPAPEAYPRLPRSQRRSREVLQEAQGKGRPPRPAKMDKEEKWWSISDSNR